MAIGIHKLGGFGQVEVAFFENRFGEDRTAMVQWTCPWCKKAKRWMTADDAEIEQIAAWVDGDGSGIQDVMPSIPPEIREAFISGVCPECWGGTFSDE